VKNTVIKPNLNQNAPGQGQGNEQQQQVVYQDNNINAASLEHANNLFNE